MSIGKRVSEAIEKMDFCAQLPARLIDFKPQISQISTDLFFANEGMQI